MVDEVKTELTDEQKATAAAILANGGNRVADTEAAAKALAAKNAEAAKTPEQRAAEAKTAEDAAKAAADKKAAEDKAAADKKAAEDTSWQEEWVVMDNPHADAAIELMKEAGMKPVEANAIFKDAIEASDLTKIDWKVLEARLGPAKTHLVRTGVETYYNTEVKAQNATKDYAYEQVGGETGWTKVQEWSKKEEAANPAFKADLVEYRKALKVGGFAAKAAINAIKDAYEKAPGNSSLVTKENKLERGNAQPQAQTTGEPLSGVQYYKEIKRAGGDRAPQHIKAQLQARRQAGRALGM